MVDATGWIFGSVFALIGVLSLIYSFSYMKKYANLAEYYGVFVMMILCLVGLSFSRNLLLIYMFWELIAFSTWRLVGFHREPGNLLIADKAFLVMFFGSCMMLLGFAQLYLEFKTFDIMLMRGLKPSSSAMLFIFAGIIAKSATLPLHTWLADAHPVAPSPMSAVLSGLVAKVGILGFVRIFVQTFGWTGNWILILAGISSLAAAGAAMVENDMKRIIAYSTVSQLGYIFLGLGLMTEMGVTAGILYFMAHAVAKAGLFLCAGIVERATGERDIRRLGGLIKTMPVTGISFLFCALSIMGIPPFFGFYPKLGTIMGLVESGHLGMAFLAAAIAIMSVLYLTRIFSSIFLGSGSRELAPAREGTVLMLAVVVILAALSLQMGLFINVPLGFVNAAVAAIK
ncbi:hypothetical protein AUJ67_08400 [Candidatus Desantisbacteria bacterium CG1_02_49_89]|nr:MAG: hypothetical protein AUJ67_08400 [Candidatus Desantisbacteria bacterium CG1_02_49_89]